MSPNPPHAVAGVLGREFLCDVIASLLSVKPTDGRMQLACWHHQFCSTKLVQSGAPGLACTVPLQRMSGAAVVLAILRVAETTHTLTPIPNTEMMKTGMMIGMNI